MRVFFNYFFFSNIETGSKKALFKCHHYTCLAAFWSLKLFYQPVHMKYLFLRQSFFSFKSIRCSVNRHDVGEEGNSIQIWKESLQYPKYLLSLILNVSKHLIKYVQ